MLISEMLSSKPRDRVCLIFAGHQWTYGQLDDESTQLACKFAALIKKNDKVFVQLANPWEQLLYFFALVKAGGVCIFAHEEMKEEIFLVLAKKYESKYALQALNVSAVEPVEKLPCLQATDLFFGVLSSGSTGLPKLFLRDQQSWLAAFPHQSKLFKINEADRLYLVGSLAYSANFNACLHVLYEGGSVIISKSKMPKTWVQEINQHKISALFMVPAHYRLLGKNYLGKNFLLHSIVTGGAKIDSETVQKLVNIFPQAELTEYYGSSELGHVSYAKKNALLGPTPTASKLFPAVQVEIIDGLIWVQSPYLIPAARPKATAGDLGSLNSFGDLLLLDRKYDIINVAGTKVSSDYVASVLAKHPGVSEVAVFGLPDQVKGEKVCAFLVRRESSLSVKQLVHYCHEQMDRFHCPQKMVFVEELPLNLHGKVDKIKLKQLASED